MEWLERAARPEPLSGAEPAEAESVRLARTLAGPDALQRALWRSHLSPGERAPALESALREMALTLPGVSRVSSCSITLASTSDVVAVFSARLDLESRSGPVTLQSGLAGLLEVRRGDGLPLAIMLEGPTTVASTSASPQTPSIVGGGTLGVTRRLRELAKDLEPVATR